MRTTRSPLLVSIALVTTLLVVHVGCRQILHPLQNAATLQRIGFQALGNGFYFKPGLFLVQIDAQDRVVRIITSRDSFGGKDRNSEPQYRAIAFAPEASPNRERELWLMDEDGSCIQVPVNGRGQGPCNPTPSSLFTAKERASGAPLKTRLGKMARMEASNVYRIADASESHQDLYMVYRNERLIFVGSAQSGGLSATTRVLNYHDRRDPWIDTELGTLELEGEYIRYELASNGYIFSGSARQVKEIPSDLVADQRFQKVDPSGFQIGGTNSNAVIDRMSSLTDKPIEEIERDSRPGGLSSAGFLGDGESFKRRLEADNTFVRVHGFTHHALAEPLFAVMNILDRIGDRRFDDFTYHGRHYRAAYESYRGFQESLFNDGLQVDRDFTVTNLVTGKGLKYSPLLPYYISRYGFYEGNTSYRVDPAAIIQVFQLDPRFKRRRLISIYHSFSMK